MKPFELHNNYPECPKCLQRGSWTLRWVDADSGTYESGRDWYISEHIKVICSRCGYWFEMKPADMP